MRIRTSVVAVLAAWLSYGAASTANAIIVDSFFDVFFMPESVYELEGPITFPPAPDTSGGTIETEMVSMMLSGPANPTGSVPLPPASSSSSPAGLFDVEYELGLDGLPPGEPIVRTVKIPPEIFNPGGPPGFYETEMLAMDLSGDGPSTPPHLIRLGTVQPSLGEHVVTDLGDGTFNVESFFDVFLEISYDAGANWAAANEAGRLSITSAAGLVPEPGSAILLFTGLAGIVVLRQRRYPR